MLNILKNTIRKKKLHFTVKLTVKNLEQLYSLLFNNVITGFSRLSLKKQTYLIVFVNYCHNFDSSISNVSVASKKISLQQNNILDRKFLGSNFVINAELYNGKIRTTKKQQPKYCIKFR